MSWISGGPKMELSGGVSTALGAGNKEMNCISKEFKSSKLKHLIVITGIDE